MNKTETLLSLHGFNSLAALCTTHSHWLHKQLIDHYKSLNCPQNQVYRFRPSWVDNKSRPPIVQSSKLADYSHPSWPFAPNTKLGLPSHSRNRKGPCTWQNITRKGDTHRVWPVGKIKTEIMILSFPGSILRVCYICNDIKVCLRISLYSFRLD